MKRKDRDLEGGKDMRVGGHDDGETDCVMGKKSRQRRDEEIWLGENNRSEVGEAMAEWSKCWDEKAGACEFPGSNPLM